MKQIGFILLAIWLVATGLQEVIGLNFKNDEVIYGILAIAAGIMILIRR